MFALRTPHVVSLHRHLRRRLDVWKVSVLPGHRVQRASNMLGGLLSLSRHASGSLSFERFVMDGQLIAGCKGKALACLGAGSAMTLSCTTLAARCSVI